MTAQTFSGLLFYRHRLSTTVNYLKQLKIYQNSNLCMTRCAITMRVDRDYCMQPQELKLKRIVLLCKVTRLKYEKSLNSELTEEELEDYLTSKGSDYRSLKLRQDEYNRQVDIIKSAFEKFKIDVRCVQKYEYSEDLVDWADAVFSAGGDGTFLIAASKVKGHSKPVIGINTDPVRSEGYLCLSKHYSTNFEIALKKIIKGEFEWLWRQRICITLSGKYDLNDCVDLYQQKMPPMEQRSEEHVQEHQETHYTKLAEGPPRELPILALNEVFIGESLAARVSFYQLSVDGNSPQKQKSSGVTVCTGTGSTSWFFNINHLTNTSVKEILQISQKKLLEGQQLDIRNSTLQAITNDFNSSLRFDPAHPRMAFCIRDPVLNGVFQAEKPRGFCKKIDILSRMWDGWVVIDGSMSFRFNDGASASLTMREPDALRCVKMINSSL